MLYRDFNAQWKPPLSLRRGGYAAAQKARRAFTLIELIVVVGIIVLLTALTVTVAVGVVGKSEQRATASTLKLLDLAVQEWETESGRKITWGVEDEPFDSSKYDINPDTPQEFDRSDPSDDVSMMNIIITRIRRIDAANDILRQIDGEYLKKVQENDSDPVRYELLDAWENPVYVVHPGRVADPRTFRAGIAGVLYADGNANSELTVFTDDDGTIRVGTSIPEAGHLVILAEAPEMGWENRLGVCKNRRIAFVSAGPDGEFGNLHLGTPAEDLTNDQREDMQMTEDNVYSYELSRERPTP